MNLFDKFKVGLVKSSSGLTQGFENIFSKKKLTMKSWMSLRDLLISSDAGVNVAAELRKDFESFKSR